MILIISKAQDVSTNDLCEVLYSRNVKFRRINVENFHMNDDFILDLNEDPTSELYNYKGKIDAIWYRRPYLSNFWVNKNHQLVDKYKFCLEELESNRNEEQKVLYQYLNCHHNADRVLGSFFKVGLNKLIVLRKAAIAGLEIPHTIVTNSKQKLIEFNQKHKQGLISKSLFEVISVTNDSNGQGATSYTLNLTDEIIESLPAKFPESLVQEKIKKKFEIRSFFLNGKIYSMAIFSQENEKTMIDFRNYDRERPNRGVPFNLPKEVENNISKLMNQLQLNCGSIDLIFSEDKKFVFLEVNPVGQFAMVGIPCNYHLEEKIADYLCYGE